MPIPAVQPCTHPAEPSAFDRQTWRSTALRPTLKPHACGAHSVSDNALRRQWRTLGKLSGAALQCVWRWM